MKLFRFMSHEEFEKYCKGAKMLNITNHNKDKNLKSSSVGFCFLNLAHYKPEEAYHFIVGCTGELFIYDICAIFETDRTNVIQSRARYAEPINPKEYDPSMTRKSFIAKEYCTKEYDKGKFKLIAYAKIVWFNWDKWEWKEEKEIGK